jgi:uncharacterized protein YkwD
MAWGDVTQAINDVRTHGCHANQSPTPRLRENSRLDDAARGLSRGETLNAATAASGYRSVSSATVHITNVSDDHDIARIVARQFCGQVTDPKLKDIGTYRSGTDVWFVIAVPFAPPDPKDRETIAHRVLDLTNEARSHARRCGRSLFAAAAPLMLAPVLESPALEHSKDMAAHDDLSHTGHDGSSPADRVTRSGYKWSHVGENLASGMISPEEVVNGWVGSPHHCENIMNPKFSQMAVAYSVNARSSGGIFWTQVFGTPR